MGVLAECPMCKQIQSLKNKRCKCGENLDAAKRSQVVNWSRDSTDLRLLTFLCCNNDVDGWTDTSSFLEIAWKALTDEQANVDL